MSACKYACVRIVAALALTKHCTARCSIDAESLTLLQNMVGEELHVPLFICLAVRGLIVLLVLLCAQCLYYEVLYSAKCPYN